MVHNTFLFFVCAGWDIYIFKIWDLSIGFIYKTYSSLSVFSSADVDLRIFEERFRI